MDKFTFGNTPAAIYLADRLNYLNDPKYTRKISSRIHDVQTAVAEMLAAHEAGFVKLHTLNLFTSFMRQKVENMAQNLLESELYVGVGGVPMPDVLSVNLMSNVLIGDLKSITRRSRQVKLLKTKQQRIMTNLAKESEFKTGIYFDDCQELVRVNETMTASPLTVSTVADPTTPASLIDRSRKKLRRLGKVSTLYEE